MAAPITLRNFLRPKQNSLKRFESIMRCISSAHVDGNLLDEKSRGLFQIIHPENGFSSLYKKLSTPQCLYCGFDPTADSLHIGNLLPIIGLLHSHRYGHKTIALVGGATARVGDPSGKSKDREQMELHDVERNVEKITEKLNQIFDNHNKYFTPKASQHLEDIRIINNLTWYKDMNVIDFLSVIGRKFRMGSMLGKFSVQSRLSKQEGMNFAEFTYQIFQSYDWYELYKKYNCTIQIGGTDQLGNITAGFDFLEKQVESERFFGLTIPLITTTSGEKLGKTAGNAVWLDHYKTSPYQLYQYFFNFADSEVEEYLKLFTFLPADEINQIMVKHNEAAHKRYSQKVLGEKITLLVHGEKELETAKKWSEILFGGSKDSLMKLRKDDFEHSPELLVTEVPVSDKTDIRDLCIKSLKCDHIKFEKYLASGGVYINYERINGNRAVDRDHDVLPNNVTLIQLGKKNHHIIKWI